ncbi:Murein DD-endopeptidase MepM and murein hydrolase activator NlpD, contain LysM domain [Seinonella peptonophila]|uniref:Murein DD-endopeptidase MepM and murein hydrolase activator NlpD, contain LysM domain n=2 Tax=Seinonella peptonophila TaxID=112248 RepID=A0A1M4XVB9_9BACL|nr:Murein DD-endopeptidase MepM and murein hydrolase activator NlpD, contain LysM domain [Seinonella peptonophila]
MSRKKVLLASSLTLCSASTAALTMGTGRHPAVYADDVGKTPSVPEQQTVSQNTNQYLSSFSAVALGNVVAKMNVESQPLQYQVKKGDCLYRIGLYHGVSYQDIAAYNQLADPNRIYIGQTLKIPLQTQWIRSEAKDTLHTIAQKHQTNVELLQQLNPEISEIDRPLEGRWVLTVKRIEMVQPTQSAWQKKASARSKSVKKKKRVVLASYPNPAKEIRSDRDFLWPVHGRITSKFGWRHGRAHKGIDIWSSACNRALIHAARSGVVSRAGYASGYGNLVVIDHGNGWETYYAHLSQIRVSKGQHLDAFDIVGNMGQTGNATGYHLHFEVRKDGQAINPLAVLD